VSAYLLIDLSTSRRLVSVVLSSLGRKGLVLVLSLLLVLLGLSSSSELETIHSPKRERKSQRQVQFNLLPSLHSEE